MFHKIKTVKALPGHCLSVQFAEGVKKVYDVKPLFSKRESFKALENAPELFSEVKVDEGGYGIIWNDDLDLSCDELFEDGVTVETSFDNVTVEPGTGDYTTEKYLLPDEPLSVLTKELEKIK